MYHCRAKTFAALVDREKLKTAINYEMTAGGMDNLEDDQRSMEDDRNAVNVLQAPTISVPVVTPTTTTTLSEEDRKDLEDNLLKKTTQQRHTGRLTLQDLIEGRLQLQI